jgi:hypothetical protein
MKPAKKLPRLQSVSLAIKHCAACKLEKRLNCFRRDLSKLDGVRYSCADCENRRRRKRRLQRKDQENARRREYYRRNKERVIRTVKRSYQKRRSQILLQKADYRAENRDVIAQKKKDDYRRNREERLARTRAYWNQNRERLNAAKRETRKQNPERDRANNERFRLRHPERIVEIQRRGYLKNKPKRIAYLRWYRHSTADRKMRVLLRQRLRAVLKHNRKIASTLALLGCSIEFFKSYFEQRFSDGMSWDRFMKGEIHIDHIRPCAAFDLSNPEHQKVCFHYSNLQPLCARDNLRKGSRLKSS